MQNLRLDRRQVLTGAGALGILAAVGTPRVTRADDNDGHNVTGSWLTHVVSLTGTFPPSEVLFGFATGGVLVETGSTDQQTGGRTSPGIGTWVAQGDNGFRAKLLGFIFDESGNPQGIFTADFAGQVRGKGDALDATYTLTARDFNGTVLLTDHGTVKGTRINV